MPPQSPVNSEGAKCSQSRAQEEDDIADSFECLCNKNQAVCYESKVGLARRHVRKSSSTSPEQEQLIASLCLELLQSVSG